MRRCTDSRVERTATASTATAPGARFRRTRIRRRTTGSTSSSRRNSLPRYNEVANLPAQVVPGTVGKERVIAFEGNQTRTGDTVVQLDCTRVGDDIVLACVQDQRRDADLREATRTVIVEPHLPLALVSGIF